MRLRHLPGGKVVAAMPASADLLAAFLLVGLKAGVVGTHFLVGFVRRNAAHTFFVVSEPHLAVFGLDLGDASCPLKTEIMHGFGVRLKTGAISVLVVLVMIGSFRGALFDFDAKAGCCSPHKVFSITQVTVKMAGRIDVVADEGLSILNQVQGPSVVGFLSL